MAAISQNVVAEFQFRNHVDTAQGCTEAYRVFSGVGRRAVVLTPYGPPVPLHVFLTERKTGQIVGRILRQQAHPKIDSLHKAMIEVTERRHSATGKRVLLVSGGELNGREY